MAKKLISFRINLSKEQSDIMPVLAEITGLNKGEVIRTAVSEFANKHGIAFPLNVPKKGKHERP